MSTQCPIQKCPCPSCPTLLLSKIELFNHFEKRMTDPLFKTILATDFNLTKKDILYLFTLMEDDLYPNGRQLPFTS